MTFLFYAFDPPPAPSLEGMLPDDVSLHWWRPAIDGLPPRGAKRGRNLGWWALDRLGLLADHRFAELSLRCSGRTLHRLVLTPRWHRFPFMADGDLQIGDVWTAPGARGRGLAWAAIAEVLRAGTGAARLWYIVDVANKPSVQLIERAGFALVGTGRRTHPLGIALAGRFELG